MKQLVSFQLLALLLKSAIRDIYFTPAKILCHNFEVSCKRRTNSVAEYSH